MSDYIKELTFEQALEKLDSIVKKLEDANSPLGDMIDLYEEGVRLSAHCFGILSSYDERLERISDHSLRLFGDADDGNDTDGASV